MILLARTSSGYVVQWRRRQRLRPAVCVLTYPHWPHPVAADHNHGVSTGHCPGVRAASQISASVDAQPHPSRVAVSAPSPAVPTDLTTSAPDRAADVVGTTDGAP